MIPNLGNAIIESQVADRVIDLDSRVTDLEDENALLKRELTMIEHQNRTLMRLIGKMAID